jgi:hypothetical protein
MSGGISIAMAKKSKSSGNPPASISGRPVSTFREKGAVEVDWTRTFHVDTADAFVNGLFALFPDSFDNFLNDAGKATRIGETVLYQLRDMLNLRFEIKKLGVSEFQIRGAHFHTPGGTNICVGLNPAD